MQRLVLVGCIAIVAACGGEGGAEKLSSGSDGAGASGAGAGAGSTGTDAGTGVGGGAATGSGGGSNVDIWAEGLEPGVNWGLAADYVDDVGIAANAFVYAAEDFETGAIELPTEEDRLRNVLQVSTSHSYTGQASGRMEWASGYEGPTTRFPLPEVAHTGERPAYFARMCFDFDGSFHPGDLNRAVGVKGFGIYYEDGSGCSDMSWFNAACQFTGWGPSQKAEANDGFLWIGHLYTYNRHPELAVDTVGTVNVTSSCRLSAYADPFHYLPFDKWHCYEVGLYLNTPGEADGEARLWIDGVLQSRTTSLRFRESDAQRPNNIQVNLHRTTPFFEHTMVRHVDNIVFSRRYIGPVKRAAD